MSAYKNFVQDFPTRCTSLLDMFDRQAAQGNREVTLLLAVATPSLIVPFERLHKDAHPSRDDQRFVEAAATLDAELKSQCDASRLWQQFAEFDWCYKKLDALRGDPDAWGLDSDTKGIGAKQTKTVLGILRNALAHGNVWTRGDPIEKLVFVSRVCHERPDGPFHSLQCSPLVLAAFVRGWVGFLKDLNIPGDTFVETPFFAEAAA
jgi:hypothetical protein